MRSPWISGTAALSERMTAHAQIGAPVAEAQMPPYMESLLSHLRLLVGVPFDYLVPDARLLPPESIRFFYLDRSWTDRMVDGAIAVGKIGSREQAHHQAQAPQVSQQLDLTERQVRNLQRGRSTFEVAKAHTVTGAAQVITGFVLRSRAVSGWPHMDVRAYDKVLLPNFDPDTADSRSHQLRTLRLERLAPAVMLALFEGIPRMVMCEEPHHGVQFGVSDGDNKLTLLRRNQAGVAFDLPKSKEVVVPLRAGGKRVLHVAALRQALADAATQPIPPGPVPGPMPAQNGAGAFAIEMLDLPWRQRFQGDGAKPAYTGNGMYVSDFKVVARTLDPQLMVTVKKVGL
jgi:hypothetical protein